MMNGKKEVGKKQIFHFQFRNQTNGRNSPTNYQARRRAGEHCEKSDKYEAAQQAHVSQVPFQTALCFSL